MEWTIIANLTRITRIIRECYEQLYASKIGNLCEIDKVPGRHKLPKPAQVELENLGRPITSEKIKLTIKKKKKHTPKRKTQTQLASWKIILNT